MLGSLGVITGKNMRGDRHLPYWLEEGTDSALRDTEEDIPVISFTAMSSAQAQRALGPSHVGSPVVLTPTEDTSSAGPGIRGGGGKGPWTDLDKFYEEEDDDKSEDEESADDSNEEQDTEDESEDQDDEEDQEEGENEGENSQHHP
jgi:AP-3 complex subunit beta